MALGTSDPARDLKVRRVAAVLRCAATASWLTTKLGAGTGNPEELTHLGTQGLGQV